MDSFEPLSDAELDELDRFLMSDATPEESMDVSMLDGFLTALVIGPNLLMPSQWLPHVWGETEEDPMTWQSQQQAERMTGLVLRHMNDIIWCLENDPDHYEPLIFEGEHEGKTVPIIDEWCMGFIMGATLDADAWAPLLEADAPEDFLLPILLYGTQAGWDQLQERPDLAARHEEFAAALAAAVLAIRDHWLPVRKARSTIRHAEPPPGRNDPCPCGSGRKFKKCCGDPARMH